MVKEIIREIGESWGGRPPDDVDADGPLPDLHRERLFHAALSRLRLGPIDRYRDAVLRRRLTMVIVVVVVMAVTGGGCFQKYTPAIMSGNYDRRINSKNSEQ